MPPVGGRIHGYKGQVLMDPTGALPGTPVAVANVNKFTIDMPRDLVEVTAFQDTNKQYVQGLQDYKGTINFWWDAANLALINAALGTVAVTLKLVPQSSDATVYFSGKAWISASIDVDAKAAVTGTGTWAAAGAWTLTAT